MDCRSARHLLDFARPRVPELDKSDQHDLDGHLAVCPDCDTLARGERQFDEHLGQAVRDVPVPQGLHERLLRRLREEREAWYRKQLGRGLRIVAAAAAVLLMTWFGLTVWRKHHLPRPTVEDLVAAADSVSPADQGDVQAWFRRQGVATLAPSDFQYQYLSFYSLTEFNQEKVPCLIFVRDHEQPRAFAKVLIFSKRQFDLSRVPEQVSKPYSPRFKVQVWRPTPEYAYVIVYSGDLNELLLPRNDRPRG